MLNIHSSAVRDVWAVGDLQKKKMDKNLHLKIIQIK